MLFMCYVDWWICCNILHTYGSAEFKLSTRMYLQLQHWKPYYGVMIMCKYSIMCVSNHDKCCTLLWKTVLLAISKRNKLSAKKF